MAKKFEQLGILIDLYQLSLGALIYCITRMQRRLDELGDDTGLRLAEEAAQKHERARRLEYDWEKQKERDPLRREGTVELDNKIDTTLNHLVQVVEGYANVETNTELTGLADEVIEELFPTGIFHITSKPFDEQHTTVNELLGRLRTGYQEHVQKLNLTPIVDRLDELNEEFGERLTPREDAIEYDQVEAATVEAREAFYRLVGHVIGEYGGDMETFNEIMAPVAEQQERTRRYFQRRGTVPEIDPESGEPVDQTPDDGQPDGGSPEEPTNDDSTNNPSGDGSPDDSPGDNSTNDSPDGDSSGGSNSEGDTEETDETNG